MQNSPIGVFHFRFGITLVITPCIQSLPTSSDPRKPILDVYHVKPETSTSKRAVIVIYDVFGLDNGRNKGICDNLAKELDCHVVMPDFYRNRDGLQNHGGIPFTEQGMKWVKTFNIEAVLDDCDLVHEYLKGFGVTEIGSLGFCWGGWVGFHCSKSGKIKAAASCHASLQLENMFGGSVEDLSKSVKTPILLCQAGNDQDDTKPGKEVEKWVKSDAGQNVEIHEFPDMIHGWVPRGDETKAEIKRDTELALGKVKQFFEKYL